jgi:predicted enzyme related to lactoylglutathione lyase
MSIRNAIASVAVKDLKSASQWYERLFGRAADSKSMPEVAEWKFEGGGWLQVYQLPERAGKGSVTLAVGDLDQQIGELRQFGIDVGEPLRSAKVNVVMIKDPDGNSIAFAEALDPSMAQ